MPSRSARAPHVPPHPSFASGLSEFVPASLRRTTQPPRIFAMTFIHIVRLTAIAMLVFGAATRAGAANDAVRGVERRVVDVRSSSGLTQKLIMTRPLGASGRLPAILFVPWMDCDSLAIPDTKLHGAQIIMRHLVERSGMVVGRSEKPGVGGSEGDCAEIDFATELDGYRAAFARLAADEWVAPGGLIVAAQSFSGGVVPLIAQDRPVRGYFVMSTWVRTWLERLLEFERLRMQAAGTPLDVIAQRMRQYSELYGIYLNEGVTPGEVIARRPALAEVWQGTGTHQYGRAARFFHQLQALNLEDAWSKVAVPALVMWGECDLAMHRVDHERIVSLVNGNAPGKALLHVVANGDHALSASGTVPKGVFDAIDTWLRQFHQD